MFPGRFILVQNAKPCARLQGHHKGQSKTQPTVEQCGLGVGTEMQTNNTTLERVKVGMGGVDRLLEPILWFSALRPPPSLTSRGSL